MVIFHSEWTSGSMDSNVVLHWSFLHSLNRWDTDLCRRLTSAFRTGSMVICHCFHRQFFRRMSSCKPVGIRDRVSSQVQRLGFDIAIAFMPAPEILSTHCRLPPRFAIPDRTELVLRTEFGSWPSQCARSQGDPVGSERMRNTKCQ